MPRAPGLRSVNVVAPPCDATASGRYMSGDGPRGRARGSCLDLLVVGRQDRRLPVDELLGTCHPAAGAESPGCARAPIALRSHIWRGLPASRRALDYIRGSTRSPTSPRLPGDARARRSPRSKEYESSSLLQKSLPRTRHDRPRTHGCSSCFRRRTEVAPSEGLDGWVRRREQPDARRSAPDEDDPLPPQPRTPCARASGPAMEP
jgi:hypothetical protein